MKVIFWYSWIYDQHHRDLAAKQRRSYPRSETVLRWMRRRERGWRTVEPKIIRCLERVTGLHFPPSEHRCYVVGRAIPFSDPLTLPIYRGLPAGRFIDTLTHELIHVLLAQTAQGNRRFRRTARWLQRRWPRESKTTIVHVVVHALHAIVIKELFGSARLRREVVWLRDLPDFRRAWEIVFEMGPEAIRDHLHH